MTDSFDPIIGERERVALTQLSRATWWREEKAGRAPARLRLSPRRIGWRKSDILAWLETRRTKPTNPDAASPPGP